MLIRGRFPLSTKSQGGLTGIALWDHGQRNINDQDFCKDDLDFYRKQLEEKLVFFGGCLEACEFQQEAHYQRQENHSWSGLDLMDVTGFGAFLVGTRYWAIHAPVAETDITDYENQLHLEWSIRETREAIDFGFRVLADAVVLHPGTYSLKNRRFWPAPDDALRITNNRRVTLNTSLKLLFNHFLYRMEEWQDKLSQFLTHRRGLFEDLRGFFCEYDSAPLGGETRYRAANQILELVRAEKLSVDLVRYCQNPQRGLRLAIENVEPPNFIINTPGQLRRVHSLMMELYQEGFEQAPALPDDIYERFRPGMVLDTTHLLNSKAVLDSPEQESIGHIFEDFEDLSRPFVRLPGEYTLDASGYTREPLLNKFIREGAGDLLFSYVAGSRRTDRYMTTHDPVKSFRAKMHLQPRFGSSTGTMARYVLTTVDPDVELNVSEVIQVLGAGRTYVMKLFDLPPELVLSSYYNVAAFLDFARTEEIRAREKMAAHVAELAKLSPEEARKGRVLERRLTDAHFYIRPYRLATELGRLGYDEAGFYSFRDNPLDPVDIFATMKEETGSIWIAPKLDLPEEKP